MRKILVSALAAGAVMAAFLPATAGDTPSPAGARVYFINIKDGDELTAPFLVQFGLSGMGVAPAGVDSKNTGHHHLIISDQLLGDNRIQGDGLNQPIPADEHHIHFGKGQTETMLDLLSGTYTLQLVLGDHNHIPHDPPVMSKRITITVK